MKTKELIKKLQEADPSGEKECAIGGNIDIFAVFETPAYYDGCLEILERDHSKDPYYNICGGIITGEGSKINIQPLSIYDAISDDVDMPVKVIGYSKESRERIEKGLEKWREEIKQIIKEVEENKYCKDESKKDLCFECKNISHTKEFYTNHFCSKLDDHIGKNWRINQDVDCNNCIYLTKKKEDNNEN